MFQNFLVKKLKSMKEYSIVFTLCLDVYIKLLDLNE